ncbi:hypothetical protein BDW22DRAFT_1432608 [Trametopsis cervina]|nr:hypothetical protein BDW22DRAFT_1432608 [Trametopsis cervina]
MPTPSESKAVVLIAGAGPSGLVLALTLAQNGVPVRIIEKEKSFHIGQRAPGIQPRTQELFHFLGILPDIMKRTSPVPMNRSYKMPEGVEPKVQYYLAGEPVRPSPDVPFPNAQMLGQASYEEILRTHLHKYGVEVELGMELVSFRQDADGVKATVARHGQGTTSEEMIITTNWLVGAEGARSSVRKQLGFTYLGETRENLRVLLADAETSGLDSEHWHTWGELKGNAVWLRPTELPGIFSFLVATTMPQLERAMQDHEAFVDLVHEITNRKDIGIGKITWKTLWKPNIRMVNKYFEGRVFLVGGKYLRCVQNAAHTHPPAGGQGANTGMQDGFNLGWKLSLVYKGLADPSLLNTYESERLPVARDVLKRTTTALDNLVNYSYISGSSPPSHPTIFRQLGVNYRWSSIVLDEQPGNSSSEEMAAYLPENNAELHAGDRAPDAPDLKSAEGDGITSLFSIYKPVRHTLLLFAPSEDDVTALRVILGSIPQGMVYTVVILPSDHSANATSSGVDEILVDKDGYAHSAYHPVKQGFSTFIIRPDGVIGAILKDVNSVKKYFSTLLSR